MSADSPRDGPERPDPRLACPVCDADVWVDETDERYVHCSVCSTTTLASNCKEVE
jgi:hypothetical protein